MAPDPKPTLYRNRLLRTLSSEDRALLEPHLQLVQLAVREVLERAKRPVTNVFFIEAGIASVVARVSNGHKIEAGIIGCEGMTGLVVVNGNDRSPHETFVQAAGSAQRIA